MTLAATVEPPIQSPTSDPSPSMDGLAVPSRGLKLMSGGANRPLAEAVAESLGVPLTRVNLGRFADGEISVRIDENVRGNDVFILQPTNPPGENILELLLLIDAAKRASAARITCVIPYYGYGRQDRKDQPRVPIGAKLMANMIVSAGADRVLGIDFHQHQLQGFFDIPVDHLYAMPVFASHYKKKNLNEPVVVAPDVGSAKMARGFAKRLNATLAIIDKRRPAANVSEVVNVVGEVTGRDCILVDDMIDTAGTVTEAAKALKALGAMDIYICASHALLSGPAKQRLTDAPIKEVAVTDTIQVPENRRPPQLAVLSVGELIAKAVRYTHAEQSVSSLFE
jgi:ribose-phosphate pyrophosphokinase